MIFFKMPKITIVNEKNGQIKYKLNLPKELMESHAVQKGDYLILKSSVGSEITFTLKRKSEIDAEKKRLLQEKIDNIK